MPRQLRVFAAVAKHFVQLEVSISPSIISEEGVYRYIRLGLG